jgi:hypothetical protein
MERYFAISTISQAAVLGLFLASSAIAQTSPNFEVTVSVVNIDDGSGTFVPVARLITPNGIQFIQIGEAGLTKAILYNRSAFLAWAGAQFPDEEPILTYQEPRDQKSGAKKKNTPDEEETKETPETPDGPVPDTKDECFDPTVGQVKSVDDLILNIGMVKCDDYEIPYYPCEVTSFAPAIGHGNDIWTIELPCGARDFIPEAV